MRGRLKRRLGHGLAAQPSGATGLRGLLRVRASTRSPRAGRRGGTLAGGSAVARRRQGVAEDLERVTGKVPSKEERAGAHRNGGSTVRQCQRRRAAAFIGGEGAPMVAGGGDEVLQLRRVKGVRDLPEISRIGSSGRSSSGSGRRWRCSARIHEGEGVAGGRRQRSSCGERWGSSGAREKGSERSGDGRTSRRASGERAARRQRDRGERGGKKVGGPGRGGGGGTQRGGAVGPGLDRWLSPGSGPSVALADDVRRVRVPAGQSGERES
jgi:hypothetical protein